MRLSHPPSRLSPPPGTSRHDVLAAAGSAGDAGGSASTSTASASALATAMSTPAKRKDDERVPKRGYRACVHCRMRKAKCDLGDVNAPSEPPCTRCRREQRSCVFLPSKRRRKTANDDSQPEVYPVPSYLSGTGGAQPGPAVVVKPDPGERLLGTFPPPPPPSSAPVAPPPPAQPQAPPAPPVSGVSPMFDPPTIATTSSQASGSSTGNSRRKRLEPDATRRIVVASFSNETDALEILAKAATDADEPEDRSDDAPQISKHVSWADDAPRALAQFPLVARGILDETTLERLVDVFFKQHHPVLTVRIPHNKAQLAALAQEDPFLLSVIVCVASRHHPDPGMKEVHEQTYALVRDIISDYACAGLQPSIGFVEGILILAENLPRDKLSPTATVMTAPGSAHSDAHGLHGVENRRSWALTGTAIRAAYGLGLDKLSLEDSERDPELERARSVWTWCYLFDRTLGLRTGLAFWSRGPALCFQGISDISQTGEAAARLNFPYMMQPGAESPGLVDANDSASMMQALMELTQLMTNAHDILYSTASRTSALVRKGEYFKFLDHFRRALESFCVAWKDKVWQVDSVRELTWCTYHFVRLYVASFAFQAHVQRAQERAEQEAGKLVPGAMSIFPRGSATSPDAVYVYESIDAAHEILGICLRLGHSGVLQYLPSRYLINFVYSGTFALKAAYSGAVGKGDIVKTTELVERVCAALLLASPDKDHPACRFGTMLRLLTRRLTELSDQSAMPSRFPSPEAGAADATMPPPIDPALVGMGFSAVDLENVHAHNHGTLPTTPALDAQSQAHALFDLGQVPPALFEVDLDVGFSLDGFWDDFTLTDNGGFPFR